MSNLAFVTISILWIALGVVGGLLIRRMSILAIGLVSSVAVALWIAAGRGVPMPVSVGLVILGYAWARIITRTALALKGSDTPEKERKS